MHYGQAGTSNIRGVHLASDYIYPYKDAGGRSAHCRVRIYFPDDPGDALVVICSELPNNPGGSITNSAEVIAAGVIQANELPTPLVWIEHWPEESADEQETFELVVFSSYQGDEDQSPGHRLVAGVQVATNGEEYGSQGEQQHA